VSAMRSPMRFDDPDRPWCDICGKTGYPTEAAADAEITRQRQRGGRAGVKPRRHYRCPSGNGHHLTAVGKGRSRKNRPTGRR
jgi:hypothetical protein